MLSSLNLIFAEHLTVPAVVPPRPLDSLAYLGRSRTFGRRRASVTNRFLRALHGLRPNCRDRQSNVDELTKTLHFFHPSVWSSGDSTCRWSHINSDVCGPGKVRVTITTNMKLKVIHFKMFFQSYQLGCDTKYMRVFRKGVSGLKLSHEFVPVTKA